MRTILLVFSLLVTACTNPIGTFQPGTYAVINGALEVRRIDRDIFDDCSPSPGEICIPSMVCGFAEYTYRANTVSGYLSDHEPQRLKIVGSLGHYCRLSYSLIELTSLVRLGLWKGRTTIEDTANVWGFDADSYIVDKDFIDENGMTSLYKPVPTEWDHCIPREAVEDYYWDEAMRTPGAFVNDDGDACYGFAVFLRDLPLSPSNKAVQTNQPSAGR
jgi:hypothetical protein